MWVQDRGKKGMPVETLIDGSGKSGRYVTKQKQDEGSEAGEFKASKGWVGDFRTRFGLKSQDDRRSSGQGPWPPRTP